VIRAHRRRHFWIWLALALSLPAVVLLALRARPAWPVNPALPDGVESAADDGGHVR
jgi:hypothetical protein